MSKVVELELGGTVRKFRFSLYSQMRFEKESGLEIQEIADKELSATNTAILVWALLIQDDPELTIDEAAKLIDVSDMDAVTEVIDELTGGSPSTAEEPPLAEGGESVGPLPDMTSN